MTNKEKLIQKLTAMDYDDLAAYLEGTIGEEISLLICHQCQKEHSGGCLMESLGLDQCPKKVSDWLQEKAC